MFTNDLPEAAARQAITHAIGRRRRHRRTFVGLAAMVTAAAAVAVPLALRTIPHDAARLASASAARPPTALELPASKLLGQAGWLPDGYRNGTVSAGASAKLPFRRVQYDRNGTQPISVIVADSPQRTPLEFVLGTVADLQSRSVPVDVNGKAGRTALFAGGNALARYTWWEVRPKVWITVYSFYDTVAQRDDPAAQRDLLRVVRKMTLVPASRWVSPTGPTRFPFTLNALPDRFTDRFQISTRGTWSTLPPAKRPTVPTEWNSHLSYLPAGVDQDALTPEQEKAAMERTPLTVAVAGLTSATPPGGPIDRSACSRNVASTGPATLWTIACVNKGTGFRVTVSSTQLRHAELDRILAGLTLVRGADTPASWVADPDGR